MIKKVSRNESRLERHKRVRAKVSGTKDIPRFIYHDYSCICGLAKYCHVHKISRTLSPIEIVYRVITKKYLMDSLYVHLCDIDKIYDKINTFSPRLVCINDSENSNYDDRLKLKKILFPYKNINKIQ